MGTVIPFPVPPPPPTQAAIDATVELLKRDIREIRQILADPGPPRLRLVRP